MSRTAPETGLPLMPITRKMVAGQVHLARHRAVVLHDDMDALAPAGGERVVANNAPLEAAHPSHQHHRDGAIGSARSQRCPRLEARFQIEPCGLSPHGENCPSAGGRLTGHRPSMARRHMSHLWRTGEWRLDPDQSGNQRYGVNF